MEVPRLELQSQKPLKFKHMKHSSFIPSMLAIALGAQAAFAGTYYNYITQTDGADPSISKVMPDIPDKGSAPSDLAVTEGGSRFELYTVESGADPQLLAQTFVHSFAPKAKLAILSDDPAMPPRTRADQVYKLETEIVFSKAPGAPAAANEVTRKEYLDLPVKPDSEAMTDTADVVDSKKLTSVPAQTSYDGGRRSGDFHRERWEIWSVAYKDQNDNMVQEQPLASASVLVYPVTEGSIDGLKSNAEYRFSIPTTTLTYTNVYPSSTVQARIWPKGKTPNDPEAKIIPGSSYANDTDLAQKKEIVMPTNWMNYIPADGGWSIRLEEVTPWHPAENPHPLTDPISFSVDRNIEVNSSVTTME